MSSFLRRVAHALCVLISAIAMTPATAQAAPTNIRAELVAQGPVAPGATVTLAIAMHPGEGWHGYWLNPGDAGLGMRLDWTLPAGARAGEPEYPVPDTLLVAGLMNHVYKHDYAVLVPFTAPASARPGDVLPIALDARWLACTDKVCVPEQARLETGVRIGRPTSPDARFEAWRAQLPAPLDAQARVAASRDVLHLAIPLPAGMALQAPHVFVAQDGMVAYAPPQRFSRNGDALVVELRRASNAKGLPERLTGVLRLNPAGDGVVFTAVPGKVPPPGVMLEDRGNAAPAALPLLLLAALVGGLLLNVMPCVFPILSLKALSLARAGESEAQARAEGLAYGAGVITACLGLGGLLLALRAGGEQVGWAFQLQEPGVVVALLLLACAITANFLGLFEIALPGMNRAGSPQGAFVTGLLAAFVATPCTGPFMASAMGAALLLPIAPALALFAALGLGIALPFLLVAFVPALRRRLPRPGPWMTRFRRWMALPMGLTALALLWLASRTGGTGFALGAGVLSVLLLGSLFALGARQRRGESPLAPALSALAIASAAVIALPSFAHPPVTEVATRTGALPFSQAALDKARATDRPVFVWMTADWCLTCKVNEQAAIEREDTIAAFRQAGVIVLRGDWTRRDPAITRYLAAHGAAGVPHYAWYAPGSNAPRILPQVLTRDMLVSLAQGR